VSSTKAIGIPPASSPAVLKRMRSQKQTGTKPELELRRVLHRKGLRFVTHRCPIPGVRLRADILFTKVKVAVFLDGCFWHCCPVHGSQPRANYEWWRGKLLLNQKRDSRNNDLLGDNGWHVLRIWEHEDPEIAARDIAILVENLRSAPALGS
jgi:DNA mismatch endonuclease, patch repair protein